MSKTTTPRAWITTRKTQDWPWPQMGTLRGKPVWLEVTEADWDHALNVLPPVYLVGAFQIGEPAAHDRRGDAIRATYVQIGERFFAAELTQREYPEARGGLDRALAEEDKR